MYLLISSLNRGYQKGKLAITQRRGIISLIPKKDKASNELKNWRPTTLLNCDYKIASKAIASRLKFMLSDLIDHDQTGFLKGCSIAENICLINDVISYTHLKDILGLLTPVHRLRKSIRYCWMDFLAENARAFWFWFLFN